MFNSLRRHLFGKMEPLPNDCPDIVSQKFMPLAKSASARVADLMMVCDNLIAIFQQLHDEAACSACSDHQRCGILDLLKDSRQLLDRA